MIRHHVVGDGDVDVVNNSPTALAGCAAVILCCALLTVVLAAPACNTPRPTTAIHSSITIDALRSSPCLATTTISDASIGLATLRDGASVFLSHGGSGIKVHCAFTVCVDDPAGAQRPTRRRVVGLGRGLAVMLHAAAAELSPVPVDAAGWRRLRHFVKEDAGQVGCLKKLAPGTALFDRPDSAVVGVVLDSSIPYGKWGFVRTASRGWALLRVNLGFGPFEVWLQDEGSSWCP